MPKQTDNKNIKLPVKKNGTADKRYMYEQQVKTDGTRDKRCNLLNKTK